MNIVITTETYLPFVSGVSTSTDNIARFMARRGHQVTIVAPRPTGKDDVPREPNLQILRVPAFIDPFFHEKTFSPIPLPIPELLRILKKDHVDLVHIQEPGAIGWCALMIAKVRGIPVFAALHTDPEQIMRIIAVRYFKHIIVWFLLTYERLFYNATSMIMVPTSTFRKSLHSIGITRPIVPVSNGVDTTIYRPLDKKQLNAYQKSRGSHEVRFLYLGRVDTDKHIDVIIRALGKTKPSIRLIIVGKGNTEESLHALARERGVSEKISWLGLLTGPSVIKMYQTSDCFVIMSPYETQSIVTLEAIACGLPVLACNKGALPELCHDGVNGYTVPAGDFKTLAKKMDLLASDRTLRTKMGKESRKISLPHDRAKALATLEAFYKTTLALKSIPE